MRNTRRSFAAAAGTLGIGLLSGCTGSINAGSIPLGDNGPNQATGFFRPNPSETDVAGFRGRAGIEILHLPTVEEAIGTNTHFTQHKAHKKISQNLIQMEETRRLVSHETDAQFLVAEGTYDQEETKEKLRARLGGAAGIDREYNGYQIIGGEGNLATTLWALGPDNVGWFMCDGGRDYEMETAVSETEASIDAERGNVPSAAAAGGVSEVVESGSDLLYQRFSFGGERESLVSSGRHISKRSETEAESRHVFYLLEEPELSDEEIETQLKDRVHFITESVDGVETKEDAPISKDGRVWSAKFLLPIDTYASSS